MAVALPSRFVFIRLFFMISLYEESYCCAVFTLCFEQVVRLLVGFLPLLLFLSLLRIAYPLITRTYKSHLARFIYRWAVRPWNLLEVDLLRCSTSLLLCPFPPTWPRLMCFSLLSVSLLICLLRLSCLAIRFLFSHSDPDPFRCITLSNLLSAM